MDRLTQTGKGYPTTVPICPNGFIFTEPHPVDAFTPTPRSPNPICIEHHQPVPEYPEPKMTPEQLEQLSTQLQFYWNTFGLSVPEYPYLHPVFLPQQLRQLSHQIQQYRTIFPMQQSHYNAYYPPQGSPHLRRNHSNVSNWENVEQQAHGTHHVPKKSLSLSTLNSTQFDDQTTSSTTSDAHTISTTNDSPGWERQPPTKQQLRDQSFTTKRAITLREKFKCGYCTEKFSSVKKLRSHCISQHPDLPIPTTTDDLLITQQFKCAYCPQTLSDARQLTSHCAIRHPEVQNPTTIDGNRIRIDQFKLYKCDECQKSFGSQFSLNRHKESHLSGSVECSICKSKFKSQFRLRVHMKNVHTAGKITDFKCPDCGTYLDTQKSLNHHLRSHGTSPTKKLMFKCTICSKVYMSRHGLEYHKWAHTGKPRPKCLICKVYCHSESALLNHLASVHNHKIQI